jgi:hypothetical protein
MVMQNGYRRVRVSGMDVQNGGRTAILHFARIAKGGPTAMVSG